MSAVRPLSAVLRHAKPRVLVATALALVVAACGGDGGTRPVPVASVAITMPPASALIAGTAHQLVASPRDASGNALVGRTVTWSTGSDAVATISTAGLLATVAPGTTTVTASVEGRVATATLVVLPVPVATVQVTGSTGTLMAGSTLQLTATTRDASGGTLAGRTVTWATTDASVATVDATGFVTTIAAGTVTVVATSEAASGSFQLTVTPQPVASVTVTPAAATVPVGTTRQYAATLRATTGAPISGRAVAWGTSDAGIATIDGAGLLRAVAPGTVTVTATSEGRSGSADATVAAVIAPAIASITPALLVPGASATITGSGFSAIADSLAVSIGGAVATVTSASETQVVVTVPCVNSGSVPVHVARGGVQGAAASHPLAVTTQALAPGQSIVMTSSATSVCNELAPTGGSARYLVTLFSDATSQNTLTSVELGGNTAPSSASLVQHVSARAPVAARPDPMAAELAGYERAHWRMLERNRADYLRVRAANAARPGWTHDVRAPVMLPAVGDKRTIFYTFSLGCNNTASPIRARAIYVGPRAIIWEDSANALQSANDANLAGYYQRIAQIFERDQYETIRKYFADPLLRDAETDNDGRVHMVFSSKVNGSGAAAYVTSCDQTSPTTPNFAGSNFGQFFYGMVPTTSVLNANSTTSPDGWFAFMARTVVHEVKHIASLSARIANNAPTFEQSWLEEGSARMAEEMWVRDSLEHVPWKGNTGFGSAATNGVYCDFNLADAACNARDPLRRPSWGMRRQLNEIGPKLHEPWNWSPYGEAAGQTGGVFYNTTWSLLRWTIDRYGASDEAFLRALTSSTTSGMANIGAVAGASSDQILGGWGMALYTDDYPGMPQSNPDLQFQTWNLRSIYAGLNASPSWVGSYPTPYPVTPVDLPFGSFVVTREGLRGGAHVYYEMAGAMSSSQLLHVRGVGGLPIPPTVRIAIARLQ